MVSKNIKEKDPLSNLHFFGLFVESKLFFAYFSKFKIFKGVGQIALFIRKNKNT